MVAAVVGETEEVVEEAQAAAVEEVERGAAAAMELNLSQLPNQTRPSIRPEPARS